MTSTIRRSAKKAATSRTATAKKRPTAKKTAPATKRAPAKRTAAAKRTAGKTPVRKTAPATQSAARKSTARKAPAQRKAAETEYLGILDALEGQLQKTRFALGSRPTAVDAILLGGTKLSELIESGRARAEGDASVIPTLVSLQVAFDPRFQLVPGAGHPVRLPPKQDPFAP